MPEGAIRGRFVWAWLATALVVTVVELSRSWIGGASGVAALLVLQLGAISAVWTLVSTAVALGVASAVRKRLGEHKPELTLAVLIPPSVLAFLLLTTALHRWGQKAFVRQDLAAALLPIVEVVLLVVLIGAVLLLHHFLRNRLLKIPRWLRVGGLVLGGLAALGIHLASYPELLADQRIGAVVLACVAGLVALGVGLMPRRLPAIGRRGALIAAVVTVVLSVAYVTSARRAPFASAAVNASTIRFGIIPPFVVGWLATVGDSDGDGFGVLSGFDCDNSDAAINPLAREIAGNGIDEDCFEGDLAPAVVTEALASRRAKRRAPKQRVENVVLITVDTLRHDAVGWAGSKVPTTPRLDVLAKKSTVLTRAYAHAPSTRRSFPTLLASRYPSQVHWEKLKSKYPYTVSHDDNVYLAELLSEVGIETSAVLGFGYAGGARFDQGFKTKVIRAASKYKSEINADVVVDEANKLLGTYASEQSQRFFMWLHFYEAHAPYARHKGIKFGRSHRDLYNAEIRWIDNQLARFLDELERLGLSDKTAIVFTSDHGEEFGEHGGKNHGDLYPEDLRVPMFIFVPGIDAQKIRTPVGLVDVAPTVLELFGVSIPDNYQGDSLLPWVEGEKPPDNREVFAELIPDRKVPRRVLALIDSRWHYIVDFGANLRELFDISVDPRAKKNLYIDDPAAANEMERRLRRHYSKWSGPSRITTEQ